MLSIQCLWSRDSPNFVEFQEGATQNMSIRVKRNSSTPCGWGCNRSFCTIQNEGMESNHRVGKVLSVAVSSLARVSGSSEWCPRVFSRREDRRDPASWTTCTRCGGVLTVHHSTTISHGVTWPHPFTLTIIWDVSWAKFVLIRNYTRYVWITTMLKYFAT